MMTPEDFISQHLHPAFNDDASITMVDDFGTEVEVHMRDGSIIRVIVEKAE